MKLHLWAIGPALLACALLAPAKSHAGPVTASLSVSVRQNSLWPPNHNLIDVGLDIRAKNVTVTDVIVYSDEPEEDQTGDGHHSPDAKFDWGKCPVLRLRSERKGNSDGRVYLIVVTGCDRNRTKYFAVTAVVVPHSPNRKGTASVQGQASAAIRFTQMNGRVPNNFRKIGIGPVIGPKQ